MSAVRFLAVVRVLLLSRARLVAENLALRRQLIVLKRGMVRPLGRCQDRLSPAGFSCSGERRLRRWGVRVLCAGLSTELREHLRSAQS